MPLYEDSPRNCCCRSGMLSSLAVKESSLLGFQPPLIFVFLSFSFKDKEGRRWCCPGFSRLIGTAPMGNVYSCRSALGDRSREGC